AHAQRGRAIGAEHIDTLGLGTRSVQGTGLVFLRARRHRMVGPEGAKLVIAMLAAHRAAAVDEPDLQGDQTVRTNRHKVRGRLAHGHFPRAGKSKELKQGIGSPSWRTVSALDLFRKPCEFQPAFMLPASACPKNRHDASNPRRHWHCVASAKATAPGSRLIQGAVGWLSADHWVTNDHGLFFVEDDP